MKRKILILTSVICILISLYCIFAFSEIPFIASLRQAYVQTAMGTLRHQWLATKLLPETAVDEAMAVQQQARDDQTGIQTQWERVESIAPLSVTDKDTFLACFYELNPQSMEQWLQVHPAALDRGWENLHIAPEDASGLITVRGEPVLAVDVPNSILIVQVETARSKGVLAIAKDPAGLSVAPSSQLGTSGETVGVIAQQHGGILAITGGAFHDTNEAGNGGDLAGFAMCSGMEYGTEHLPQGNKRVEIRNDDLLYITDSTAPVSPDCTDAVEFRPALIADGEILVHQGWAGLQPRVCLGQNDRYEILLLVMEGRILSEGIVGASVQECARLLKQHGCMQAINLDGGNSAMMWYDGNYLTRCCDRNHPDGRPVPTAVIWSKP